jgi:large subunit ribosomal protein L24
MKSDYSKTWVASKQTRKQRKYRFNAPFHTRSKFLHANLSKELRKKYDLRNIRVKKGDKVKILRGNHRKHVGKVERVDVARTKVFIEKVEMVKKDGNKSLKPFDPSNLQIIELDLSDKRRMKRSQSSSKESTKKQVKQDPKKEVKKINNSEEKTTKGNSNGKKSS